MPGRKSKAEPKGPASEPATSGDVAGPVPTRQVTVGRRFSRRNAVELQWATPHGRIEELDPDDHTLNLRNHWAAAATVLAAERLTVAEAKANHEPDSRIGLAGRIVELCEWLEAAPGLGYSSRHLMLNAYRLGRLVVLAKAYGIDAAAMGNMQAKGAKARTKFTADDRRRWRQLDEAEFAQHTARRASELIAARLGLPDSAVESIRKALRPKAGKPL